jgi:putative thioredoxin
LHSGFEGPIFYGMTAITATHANFDEVVLRASTTSAVLVDFWAPWCAPCRALAPILDRLATEFAGRLTLVKLNTDEETELAARYGVRGIPNCKLFVGGEVVDEFTGALPERALREFLAAALPSPAAPLLSAAKAKLERKDAGGALAELEQARQLDPSNEDVLLTQVEALLASNRVAEAKGVIGELDSTARPVRDERRHTRLKARVAFAEDASADLTTLREKAAATPSDSAAKLAYARALAANGDYEQALAELLAIVRADREFGDDAGRRAMLMVFEALPADSDLVRRYRRELAAAIN